MNQESKLQYSYLLINTNKVTQQVEEMSLQESNRAVSLGFDNKEGVWFTALTNLNINSNNKLIQKRFKDIGLVTV